MINLFFSILIVGFFTNPFNYMDQFDKAMYDMSSINAFNSKKVDTTVRWENANTGNRGSFYIISITENYEGEDRCVEFKGSIEINTLQKKFTADGKACLRENGNYEILELHNRKELPID